MSRFLTQPRRALGVGMLAALLGAAIVALAVGGCAKKSSVAPTQAPPRTHPLETIFEAQSQLFASPGPTLDLLKRLGVDRVKVFVAWSSVAPDPLSHKRPNFDAASPAAYPAGNWTVYDSVVRAAAARHVGLDIGLEAPAPVWATGPGVPPGTTAGFLGSWRPSAQQFGLFVHAFAERYSGHYRPAGADAALPKVDFWSIWNEPNYGRELAPQAIEQSTVEVAPALYRRLLDAAWNALKTSGHEHDTVLIGEVAPRGQTVGDQPGNFSGMVPLRFIRALYCVDSALKPLTGSAATARSCPSTSSGTSSFPREHPALFEAGGFGFHPYPQGFAPNVRTPYEPDYADLPQLRQLEHTLDGAMAAYGSHRQLSLYDTEFGYQTNPPETSIARAVHPEQAAAWANLAEYMSWSDPRVASWDQYLLVDPQPGVSSFDTGLEFFDGKRKALYDAFRMPIYLPSSSAPKGQAVEVWGCVRPLHYVRSRTAQFADVQFKASATAAFRNITRVPLTDPYGYFQTRVTFPSSGLVRISWSYPRGSGGGQIHSRTVPVSVR